MNITDQEVGYVVSNRDFLVYLDGFPSIKINDLVVNDQGVRGWVSSLLDDKVEILIVDEGEIVPGQLFKKVNYRLGIEVGEFLLGRSINPLGVPIDNRSHLAKSVKETNYELDKTATGVKSRQFITQQFVTGMTLIDTLIPIGKGQRELVMGDAHSGKTAFLIDLIVNQRDTGTICIYASIGKPISQIKTLIGILEANKALEHSIIIAASSSEPAPLIFLTPQTAFTVAEYFQQKGKDVLLILDDLGNHAKVYREISLLSGKSPGRESYPGDIFYQHSHLIERAGYFKKEYGGGSITTIPVIELNLNDFTTFIPTNLMAMTDGHLLFKASLHKQGQKPAIDISLSVSRVGRQTQNRVQNLLSSRIRQVLAEAAELETVSRFSSELPLETQLLLRQKDLIEEIIKQESLSKISLEMQAILLSLVFTSFLKESNQLFLRKNRNTIIKAFMTEPELLGITQIAVKLKSDEELIQKLEAISGKLTKICIDKNKI